MNFYFLHHLVNFFRGIEVVLRKNIFIVIRQLINLFQRFTSKDVLKPLQLKCVIGMELTISKMRHHRVMLCVLTACNASSLAAAINLVVVLEPEDRISVWRGAALTALGLVYFVTLFELFNVAALLTGAGARFRHKYRLSCGEVLDISNKLVSAVQAAFSCVTGAVVCAWSCTRDLMKSSHFMSEAYAWFGAAYFFYDIWSMYMVHVYMTTNLDYFKTKLRRASKPDAALSAGDGAAAAQKPSFLAYCRHEPVILMHHLFIGGFGFLVIVYLRGGLGDCVFGFVYLMELSTPFVSLRGVLSRLRLKSSRAYLLNGLAMLLAFLVCRVLSLPYVCLMYSRVVGLPYLEAIKSLPTGCKISICILLVPQLYWFYLMSVGAVKVFLGVAPRGKGAGGGAVGGAGGAGGAVGGAGALCAGDAHKRS